MVKVCHLHSLTSYSKLTFNSNSGSKVSFSGFKNTDLVNYTDASINWDSYGGALNFVLVPGGSPVLIEGHVNGSSYKTDFKEDNSPDRFSSIGGVDVGFDFTYFLKNESEFNYGINLGVFNTNFRTVNASFTTVEFELPSLEIGLYGNYRYVTPLFVIQPGLRIQRYASYNETSLEPRLGIKYNATEDFRLKTSGGRYSQNFTSASSRPRCCEYL